MMGVKFWYERIKVIMESGKVDTSVVVFLYGGVLSKLELCFIGVIFYTVLD